MGQEREQVAGRIAERGPRRARPHRGDQRQGEVSREVTAEAALVEELAERLVPAAAGCSGRLRGQQAARGAVEPRYLDEHPQVASAAPAEPGGQAAQAALA